MTLPMTLRFAPVRSDDALMLERQGDTLIINGTVVDIAAMADAEDPIDTAQVQSGILSVTLHARQYDVLLLLPHAAEAGQAQRWPEPITVTGDGPVSIA